MNVTEIMLSMSEAKTRLISVEAQLRRLEHNTQRVTADQLQANYDRQVEIKKLRYEKADLLFIIHTL